MDVRMDLLGNGVAQGDVANFLMANGRLDVGRMRPFIDDDGLNYVQVYVGGDPKDVSSYQMKSIQTNATLRPHEWRQLDEAVLKVAERQLVGIQDLITNGLVYNLGNAMGTTVLEYHDISDALEAEMTMDGISRAKGDRPVYTTNYLPLPIIHADYELNARVLAASRNLGNPLDTTLAERAARKVNEKLESLLFSNTTYSFGGGTIYSYLTHPKVQVADMKTAWTSATGETIVTDVITMKEKSLAKKHFGPWVLYIPAGYEAILDEDYGEAADKNFITIRDRIKAIGGIQDIKVAYMLPANTVVLVEMNPEVVRLVRGLGIQNVEWQTEGNMVTKYKVLTIQVPQIRADQEGNTGIVVLKQV